jgi:hypothetical protein
MPDRTDDLADSRAKPKTCPNMSDLFGRNRSGHVWIYFTSEQSRTDSKRMTTIWYAD